MQTFFHGWRRKAGLVALGLASLVMIGWLRSRIVEDVVALKMSETCRHSILLVDSGFWWVSSTYSKDELRDSQILSWDAHPANWRLETVGNQFSFGKPQSYSPYNYHFQEVPVEVHWRWRFCGGDFGSITRCTAGMWPRSTQQKVWYVPFWWLELPLTLISAYLIFWKRRKR